MGVKLESPTFREEHVLKVFENKVLRQTLGRKKDEVTRGWRRLQMRSFIIRALLQIPLERSSQRE
jgi:hypothetical protein